MSDCAAVRVVARIAILVMIAGLFACPPQDSDRPCPYVSFIGSSETEATWGGADVIDVVGTGHYVWRVADAAGEDAFSGLGEVKPQVNCAAWLFGRRLEPDEQEAADAGEIRIPFRVYCGIEEATLAEQGAPPEVYSSGAYVTFFMFLDDPRTWTEGEVHTVVADEDVQIVAGWWGETGGCSQDVWRWPLNHDPTDPECGRMCHDSDLGATAITLTVHEATGDLAPWPELVTPDFHRVIEVRVALSFTEQGSPDIPCVELEAEFEATFEIPADRFQDHTDARCSLWS